MSQKARHETRGLGVLAAVVKSGNFAVATESLNMSQPRMRRAFNSVASLKAKGGCCRSRIAAAIAGLRRLQLAAKIGRSVAHNLVKRGSESRRRAIAYRQTDLGDVQHSVFQKLPGHADTLNHKPFMWGLAGG